MVKSIQVFAYPYPKGTGEIRNLLGKERRVSYKKSDKLDPDEEVELTCRIYEAKQDDYGISGRFFYRYQDVINRNMPDEDVAVHGEHYTFTLDPNSKILVIHGPSSYRNHVKRLISSAIHDGELGEFSDITIDKERMKKLVGKITKFNKNNDVERPNFDFLDKPYDKLDDIDYSMGERACVTTHHLFKEHYPESTFWSPKMRIYLLNGIVEEVKSKRAKLSLRSDASFTLSQHASAVQWNRYVFETCRETFQIE